MILAILIPIFYLIMILISARLLYRCVEWDRRFTTDQEIRVYSFGWAFIWPLSGLFILAQIAMQKPGISERRTARQEAIKQLIREKAKSLSQAESDLREITYELKRMGIDV